MEERSPWKFWPEAEELVAEQLGRFLDRHAKASWLARQMEERASTRMFDWLDHLVVPGDQALVERAVAAGFVVEDVEVPAGQTVYYHPNAQLPRLVFADAPGTAGVPRSIGIKVESAEHFLRTHASEAVIAGGPYSPLRTATVWVEDGLSLTVVERRGYRGYLPQEPGSEYAERYLLARERWSTRPRLTDDEAAAMEATLKLAERQVAEVGRDTAAWIAFEVEREYWQARNWAGQIQKARQDRLGLGWANHDHHTFRSSRRNFATLIATLEVFGFETRERYYAGEEAGWGAQIMEQPVCGLVTFMDVDLLPDEKDIDFAHSQLPDIPRLGTIGLWCGLHGESMLAAGMHHLEAQFEFDLLRDDLAALGVGTMKPFSDSYQLRQAFTKGEVWPVAPERIERLRQRGWITGEQAEEFAEKGAVGSHLENLQRREGYKGFNQHNVSVIIKETDPRKLEATIV